MTFLAAAVLALGEREAAVREFERAGELLVEVGDTAFKPVLDLLSSLLRPDHPGPSAEPASADSEDLRLATRLVKHWKF